MKKDQILGILRHILTFAAGFAVSYQLFDADFANWLAAGIVTLVTLGWALFEKGGDTKTKVFSLVRHALSLAGGVLVAKGVIADGAAQDIIGGITSLMAGVWSITEKK